MPEFLSLKERQVEVRKGLHVQFTYPSQHGPNSNKVPVLVDFKKFMELTPVDLGPMPKGLEGWWRRVMPRDEYEAHDMKRYQKINRGIHQRGEMEMPDIVYPNYEGKVGIIEGRHRLRAFEAAGAEKIMVLIDERNAEALKAVAGAGSQQQTKPVPEPIAGQASPEDDTQWAEQVRIKREAFEAQKDAVRRIR